VARGFDFVMVGTDTSHFMNGSVRSKSAFEDAVAEREGESEGGDD
jgi:hypothetical protein